MKHFTQIILILTLFAATPGQLTADCRGCIKTYRGPHGRTTTVRQCSLKQKWIDTAACPRCACARHLHSEHKHPYKMYTGPDGTTSKLKPQTLAPIKIG